MKYSLAQKKSLIEQWEHSSQSRMSFCKEREIVYSQFLYWVKCHRNTAEQKSAFIPLLDSLSGKAEICFPNGIIIRMADPISVGLLSALNNV